MPSNHKVEACFIEVPGQRRRPSLLITVPSEVSDRQRMAATFLQAAALALAVPKGCDWPVHVEHVVKVDGLTLLHRSQVWLELGPEDSEFHAMTVLKDCARRGN